MASLQQALRTFATEVHALIVPIVLRVQTHIRTATPLELAGIAFYIFLIIFGSTVQLLALNFWLEYFPGNAGGAFTVLTLSASFAALIFVIALGVYTVLIAMGKRPKSNISWIATPKSIVLLIVIGMMNSLNGVLLVNATGPTPEIWQAMLLSTQMIWTFSFTRLVLRDYRGVCTKYLVFAIVGFAICVGGIILGMYPSFQGSVMSFDTKMWTLIFAVSMIPGGLYNVFASAFMRSYTKTDSTGPHYEIESAATAEPLFVKIVMLAVGGVTQVAFMFIFFPLDFAPWFGANAGHPHASIEALSNGWKCVFTCPDNYKYFLLFNLGYVCQYLGSAYLNFHSATLTAMVSQLASPTSAIVLVIVPAWNVSQQVISLADSIGAAVLIALGTVVYFLWEEMHKQRLINACPNPERTALLQGV